MTLNVLAPSHFEAPPLNPSPNGLFAATVWSPDDTVRFMDGVEIRGANYGGENAFGIWEGHYCSAPQVGQIKDGTRPEILDPFDPITVWAYDECDLTEPSRREVEARAAQILRLEEQVAIELEFANRMLEDAGTPEVVTNLKEAVGYIEGVFAKTSTLGYIHVSASLVALEVGLFIKSGTTRVSPSGHTWVIGGGYVEGLENTLVATSQPFGWRNEPTTRTAPDVGHNLYAAVAERTVTIGYEALVAAATITP